MHDAPNSVFRMGWSGGLVLTLLVVLALTHSGAAASPRPAASSSTQPVRLGAADSFAVLGASTITNAGTTVINGNLGLHPGTAVVGFPPGTVNGTEHRNDAVARQAVTDLTTAYDDAAARPSSATSPPDLGGRTLTGGVYRSGLVPSLGLTGRLTLDARGDPRAVFIFQIASTLVTAPDSSVRLANGAQACNVFWQVGSSATLGTRTAFQGSVLALQSISVNHGAAVNGRLLARNGAVTLLDDTVTRPRCAAGTGGGPDPSPGGGTGAGTAPAPQTMNVWLSKPSVIGRETSIVVEAMDPRAPVSGMSVKFGRRRDVFGTSACRPPDSRGNVPRAFRAGTRTRLAFPHRFRRRGKQTVLVRVDAGGCSSPPTSVYLSGARSFSCGENIGFGDGPLSSPRSMMRAWMNSAPHRANILTRDFREVGLGGVPGIPGRAGAGGGTNTTVFGTRR